MQTMNNSPSSSIDYKPPYFTVTTARITAVSPQWCAALGQMIRLRSPPSAVSPNRSHNRYWINASDTRTACFAGDSTTEVVGRVYSCQVLQSIWFPCTAVWDWFHSGPLCCRCARLSGLSVRLLMCKHTIDLFSSSAGFCTRTILLRYSLQLAMKPCRRSSDLSHINGRRRNSKHIFLT